MDPNSGATALIVLGKITPSGFYAGAYPNLAHPRSFQIVLIQALWNALLRTQFENKVLLQPFREINL
jgi:hypothetical protein